MYRRDSVELRLGVGWFLAIMRLAAFGGLLIVYLDLQKWSDQKEIQNSRVLVLTDTSISMGLPATDSPAASPGDTRIGQVISEVTAGHMLDDLRATHDVNVWRFDQDLGRIVSLSKFEDLAARREIDAAAEAARQTRLTWLRYVLIAAAGVFAISVL